MARKSNARLREDRSGRPAHAALRRGRSDPASVHPAPRPDRRDRQGRAPRQEPLRRAPRAVLSPANGALRGPQRAAHGDERGHGHRPSAACASTAPRSTARPARATPSRACSRRPSRILACSRCCATSSRCSTPRPDAGDARQPARLSPQAAARRRPRAAARGLRLVRRGRPPRRRSPAPPAASSAAPARRPASSLGEEAHTFMTGALGVAAGRRPAAGELALRQAERAIAETVEHHAHVRWRAAFPAPAGGYRIARHGSRSSRHEVGVRLRRGIAGDAQPPRRQGRERRRDDAHPGRRPRPGGVHDHDGGLRLLHGARPVRPRRDGRRGRRGARPPGGDAPARRSAIPTTRCSSPCAPARASRCPACSTPS